MNLIELNDIVNEDYFDARAIPFLFLFLFYCMSFDANAIWEIRSVCDKSHLKNKSSIEWWNSIFYHKAPLKRIKLNWFDSIHLIHFICFRGLNFKVKPLSYTTARCIKHRDRQRERERGREERRWRMKYLHYFYRSFIGLSSSFGGFGFVSFRLLGSIFLHHLIYWFPLIYWFHIQWWK